MTIFTDTYASSSEAAMVLGIHHAAVQKLFQRGTLKGEKVANRWFIQRAVLEEFAKTYVPQVGRPRQRRKYTRRNPV